MHVVNRSSGDMVDFRNLRVSCNPAGTCAAQHLIEAGQLELFDVALAEARPLHHPVRPGFPWLTLNWRQRGADDWPRQKAFPVDRLEWAIRQIFTRPEWRKEDWWISQADFFRPDRRKVHLWSLGGCWVDIDLHSARSDDATIRYWVERVLETCSEQGVPQPSVIVWSGGGLHVKWLFGGPLPAKAFAVWQACQRTLHAAMVAAGLPSDDRALDASRILRVVGTVNQKYADVRFVQVVHTGPTWPWHIFRAEVLPYSYEDIREMRRRDEQRRIEDARARMRWQHAAERWRDWDEARQLARDWLKGIERRAEEDAVRWLWHDRLIALRDIAIARGGIQKGQRNGWCWVLANACAWGLDTQGLDLFHEVSAVMRHVAPTYTPSEIRSSASSVMARLKEGKDRLYRFKTDTLIRELGISTAEAERYGLMDAGRRGHGTKNPGVMGLPPLRNLPFPEWKKAVQRRFAEGGRYSAAIRDESALVDARRRAQEASSAVRRDSSTPDRLIAQELRSQGLSLREIAQRLRVHHSTVADWLNED